MSGKKVIIIGAGLGGLCAAIKLKQAGHSFVIIEKLSKVGGTWAQNTYPGVACDVPVALYQFEFAQSIQWSRAYPQGHEIQAYAEELADRYQLRPNIHLGAEAVSAVWQDAERKWQVTTASGEVFEGDILVGALGQLNRPNWPEIPGQNEFDGQIMHAAAWDHNVSLQGKRVGVVGSAASAVQIIPEIAKQADELTVFQRSPNWVIPRRDVAVSAEESALVMSNPEIAAKLGAMNRQLIYENADYFFWQVFEWTDVARQAYTKIATTHLHAQIVDPELRAKLTPDYPIGCRRILISDDYFPALEQKNVTLQTAPIDSITPTAIVTSDGCDHPLDIIVYATGFETTGWRWSTEITGRDGASLADAWSDGPEAYLGITVADFPNFFMLYGPNTNLGHNAITFMLEKQVDYMIAALAVMTDEKLAAIAPTRAAQDAFNAELQANLAETVWSDPSCNSWYKTAAGRITQNWGSHTRAYAQAVSDVRIADYETQR